MTPPIKTGEEVLRYREGMLASDKYRRDAQQRLKGRVFETFDRLLRHRDRGGLEPGMRLLDLGSADGAFVSVCREAGLEASGLDISDGVNFETDDLPAADASLDVITAISVIEHLHSPAKMLSEAIRVLKPGGAIVLVCPNWRYSSRIYFDDPTHVHPYSHVSLSKVLRNFNFGDVYVVPWLVKKSRFLWDVPNAFFVARWLIPFRGDGPAWIPSVLKGRSASILALGVKPEGRQALR